MDRQALIEDLKNWLFDLEAFGDTIEPEDVLERIAQLEELYE